MVLLDLLKRVYHIVRETHEQPLYVIGAGKSDTSSFRSNKEGVLISSQGVRNREIEKLFWGQIIPPAMVEAVGRDRILSAPNNTWKHYQMAVSCLLFVEIQITMMNTRQRLKNTSA
jgi:hypothetical protein